MNVSNVSAACRLPTTYALQGGAMAMEALVVDDSRLARTMLQSALREALVGVRVAAVNDLESALERAGGGAGLDLVLLDLGLPGCAGLESLARFRARFPRIPVVVISATDDRQSVEEALEAGAAGYITKASSREEIIVALRRVAAGGTCVPPEFALTEEEG